MGTTLTGIYHTTVNLDQGSIGPTVTVTGTIQVGFYSGIGIYGSSSLSHASVTNYGDISGGSNSGTGAAAAGVYLGAAGTVTNEVGGYISGGTGWFSASGNGFSGGDGVDLGGGGMLTNDSGIAGGNGGSVSKGTGGEGGTGVFANGSTNLTNVGTIAGGTGGNGAVAGGYGGVGVFIDGAGTLTNGSASPGYYPLIEGGAGGNGGGASGGIGVAVLGGASVMNYAYILGGAGGTGDAGGIGLLAETSGQIVNHGEIFGGEGAGTTAGPGTAGGVGVQLTAGSSLSNDGDIVGGMGGSPTYVSGHSATGTGGIGGTGLLVNQSSGTITNYGTISGGYGGSATLLGGNGGTGLILEGGASLLNGGTINGGRGGYYTATNGASGHGGIGVYLNGGTLTNAGVIAGGYNYQSSERQFGAAIVFGTVASTLIVDPGAIFGGDVVANAKVADVLDLATVAGSTTVGTLSALGTQFTGFSTVTVEAGAKWTLSGTTNTLTAQETLNVDGSLAISGELVTAGAVNLTAGAALQTAGSGVLQLAKISLAGGTLASSAGGTFVLGTSLSLGVAGAVTVESRELLAGFGTIAGNVAGTGGIEASGGTLVLTGTRGSTLALSAAAKSTLDFTGGGALGAVTGKGTLMLDGAAPYTLTSKQTVKIASIAVDAAASLSGAGTITGALSNLGQVTASGGELLLKGAASGNGTFAAESGATLDFAGGVKTAGLLTGTGEIVFGGASTLSAGVHLSAVAVVQAANLTLGSGVSLSTAFGETFAIDPSAGGTVTLAGASGDRFTNAGSFSAGGTGTADVNVAFINSANVSAGSGTLSFLGSVTNTGTMTAAGGNLTIAGQVGGDGTLVIGPSGTLTLDSASSGSQFVQFLSLNGVLDLAQPNAFGSLINDFGANCKIDLLNTASTSFTFSGGVLSVENGSTTVASLQFIGPYNPTDFAIGSDGHSGTVVTFV